MENTRNNPINSPIRNPINNKRIQKKARLYNEMRIKRARPGVQLLTEAQVVAEVDRISALTQFRGRSLDELLAPGPVDGHKAAVYFGYTGRMINQEYLAWLSERGAGGD